MVEVGAGPWPPSVCDKLTRVWEINGQRALQGCSGVKLSGWEPARGWLSLLQTSAGKGEGTHSPAHALWGTPLAG